MEWLGVDAGRVDKRPLCFLLDVEVAMRWLTARRMGNQSGGLAD